MERNDETPRWCAKLYRWIWNLYVFLILIGLIVLVIWLRIEFDKWYFNLLTK